MNAIDCNTNKPVPIHPIVLAAHTRTHGVDDLDWQHLYLADENTMRGIWMEKDGRLYIDMSTNGTLYDDAAEIFIGTPDYKDGWEDEVNELLDDYEFNLGAFDRRKGDRYALITR